VIRSCVKVGTIAETGNQGYIPMGFGDWVKRPTLMIGDNRNARDWANTRLGRRRTQTGQIIQQHIISKRRRGMDSILSTPTRLRMRLAQGVTIHNWLYKDPSSLTCTQRGR
jgi:hypothetical protein